METLGWVAGIVAAVLGLGEWWWASLRAEARRELPEDQP